VNPKKKIASSRHHPQTNGIINAAIHLLRPDVYPTTKIYSDGMQAIGHDFLPIAG
jgi:hypothetical protein